MAKVVRFVPCVFALCIITSLLAGAAWGGGGGVSLVQTPTTASGDDTVLPAGASQDWWSAAQEDIRQSEYHISWQEGTGLPDLAAGYQAPNRAQNLRTYFTESGIEVVPRTDSSPEWTLGLALTGYGYQDSIEPVAAAEMAVGENRADYDRGDVTEWYVNTEEGLEQGFTLNAAPSGPDDQGSALVLRMSLSGDLTPALAEEGQAIDFTTPGGVRVLRYAGLEVTDAEGKILDASLSVNGDGLSITIDAASAAFPITVDPLLDTPSWTAEGNLASAEFGCSVATAGDVNGDGYSDVIVGACKYTNVQTEEGRAYVYLGSATGLGTGAAWTAESNDAGAEFGCSVGTAGDVNGDGYSDVIIGARFYTNVQADEGAAFVWYGSSGGLNADDEYVNGTPTNADWRAESNQADANFGRSVGTAGDVNGDTYSDVIVGAPNWERAVAQSAEGRAYVYLGSASGLATGAVWAAEGNQAGANFGWSVGTAGDVNGDVYADIIVGAQGYGSGGGAFVYHGSSGGPNSAANWTAESDQAGSNLGASVATAGDVNGDGYADVIVGGNEYDTDALSEEYEEGIALVWHGSDDGVNEDVDGTPGNADRQLVGRGTNDGDGFGCSVGTAGDVDGDGYADVIVGAVDYYHGQDFEGAAVVYRGSSVGLDQDPLWSQEGNMTAAHLGCSVGTAGDVNGDGYSDVIAGAYWYENGQDEEGAAFVYHGYAGGLMATPLWGAESNQASADFGCSVGTAGDVNGDSYADVIVGAQWYDGGQTDEGHAYVFHGSAVGLNTVSSRTLECDQAGALFGLSVGTAGDVNGDGYDDVIVGASMYSSGASEVWEGAAWVYHGSASGVGTAPSWSTEGNQAGAGLGTSVGTAGDVNGDGYADVIVGAAAHDGAYANSGRASVFLGSAAGLSAAAGWTVDGSQEDAYFGWSAATAGDVNGDGFSDVIVGARDFSNSQDHEGAAFVYGGSAGGLSTTPAWSAESNRAGAMFGGSVGTAGDVNGDGYADVIVGASAYTNGQDHEGAATVYHGSASWPSLTPNWITESGQAGAQFGRSVGTAGDVNGDGYADVVVGAPYWENPTDNQTNEGGAAVYHGSATGLGSAANRIAEIDQANANFGYSVGTAGDVNGDGYADVVVGAPKWQDPLNPQSDEGGAALYYGGNHRGVGLRPQQERSDGSAPIAHLGRSDSMSGFRLSVDPYSPYGVGRASVQCEVKPLGTPFDGTGLRESGTWFTTVVKLNYTVTGLSANTVYHWRVRLHYSAATTPFQQYSRWFTMPSNGWQEADLRTATLPAVTTNDATSVTSTSATLNGTLTSLGAPVSVAVSFEYGTQSGGPYTAVAAGTMTITSTFSAGISGLTAGTKYYFRTKAVGAGTSYGSEKSFAAGTTPPEVTTNDVTNKTTDSATLNGTVISLGGAASVDVSFEWGTASESYSGETTLEAGKGTGDFSFNLTGLAPGNTYYFRAKAAGAGTDYGMERTFTTLTAPPEVTTNDSASVTADSATLNGTVTSLGGVASVTVSFEYGTTSGGPYTVLAAGTLTAPGTFSADLSGLSAGTLYYFRAVATGSGTSHGIEKSFTAGTTPPSVTTGDATYVTNTTARLNGSLTSAGGAASSSVSFEYGTASGSYTHETDIQIMTSNGDFSINLSGLTPGTTYYFRAKAAGAGTAYGKEETFTTGTAADETTPGTPQVTDDGESATSTTEIHAMWCSADAESGIVEYWYALGTTAGGNDVVNWTSAGPATETTITGLSLTPGQTYYVSVKAVNGQGLTSEVGSSDGITISSDDAESGLEDKEGMPFWAWILVAVGILAAGVTGIVFWRKRSAKPA